MKALISLEHDAEHTFLDLNKVVSGPLVLFGVDGKSLSAWQYFVYGVSGRRWPLTPGEVGCSLSHLAALQAYLESGEQFLTVYEADAFVRDEFCEPESVFQLLIAKLLQLLPRLIKGVCSGPMIGVGCFGGINAFFFMPIWFRILCV
ncbi:MAG: hypothetical protein NTW02_03850 [Cyanobium sp. LacPavin_0920_WC12_MAG_62_9]|nr:hypothetical protein [Cyanobium sp. LacPavin_0920_WC12_MAG_62_9]